MEKILEDNNLDAFYINKTENVFWLTNFWSKDAILIITKNKNYLLCSPLDIETAKKNANKNLEIIELKKENLVKIFKQKELKKVGFEKNNLKVATFEYLSKLNKTAKMNGLENTFENLRIQKTKDEISKIKRAANITDESLKKCLKLIKKGITEKTLSWKLEQIGRDLGANKTSFDFIIAFGENSAIPHHKSSNRKLKENEPVLVDMGFEFERYMSDLTRSFFYGKPTNEWLNIYSIVAKAHEESAKSIKINSDCKNAHKIAVDIFAKEKLEKKFIHGLGHGVGLEIHEMPVINSKSKNQFKENTIFTIEPGLYFKNQFGIRIEDLYLIEKTGVKRLSNFSRDIKSIVR